MNNNSQNPYIHLLRSMWHYAPDKKLFFWMFSFAIISKVLWLIEPYILGQLINTIQTQGKEGRNRILRLLAAFCLSSFFFWIFHGISRIREEKIKFQVGEQFTASLFHKTAGLPMERHSDNHSGKTIDKVNKAVSALKEFSGNNFMYISTIIFSIGSLISLSVIRRPAGLIIVLLSIITVIIVQKYNVRLVTLLEEKNSKEHEVMSTLFDFLSNIKTVITLRFEHHALETMKHKVAAIFPSFQRYAIVNERKWFSMDMMMAITVFIILSLYLYHSFTTQGVVLIGTFTMLWQYIEKMRQAFENFTWQRNGIMEASTNLHTIDSIEEAYTNLESKSSKIVFDSKHPFHIQKLSFSYTNDGVQKQVLQDIALDLIPGKRIALVGGSGSGKSTLMMLLRGLYTVDHVELIIEEERFNSLEPLSHYASLIPQDPEIFEQTIRYNITMGIDVDDSTILHYTDMARFKEVLDTLPHGLDTDIKEKGINLSGGQKQRLALARGLLMAAQSRLLLLDESTSSVDIHNEKLIYEQIFSSHPDTCIVASIHKLHLLPMFDMIYVLDNGSITESGSFKTLTSDPSSHLTTLRTDYQVSMEE